MNLFKQEIFQPDLMKVTKQLLFFNRGFWLTASKSFFEGFVKLKFSNKKWLIKAFNIILIMILIALSATASATALNINEIMYNPLSESTNEWVELYNAKNDYNLTRCYFNGKQLSGQIEKDSYLVLVRKEELFLQSIANQTNETINLKILPLSFGYGLNNNGGLIILNCTDFNVLFNYTGYIDLVEKGYTLSKDQDGSWKESSQSGGTPGAENIFPSQPEEENNPEEQSNQEIQQELQNQDCDWALNLELNESIFQRDNLDFKLVIERIEGGKQNVSVNGIIRNFYGEIVKEYSPWKNASVTNYNSKKYSPNLPEGIYQVSFWIEDLTCNDLNKKNDQVNKLLAINPDYGRLASSLEIENIYLGSDDKAEWGDQFTAKINLYKGNETKTAVELWVEKEASLYYC